MTLTSGSTLPLTAVALAKASPPSAGARPQLLGDGLICFAGGAGEAIWAWDLRAGKAKPLYELSTGNMSVSSLSWHEGTNSLIAACESLAESRMGSCSREDFIRLRVGEESGIQLGDDEDEEEDYEEERYCLA